MNACFFSQDTMMPYFAMHLPLQSFKPILITTINNRKTFGFSVHELESVLIVGSSMGKMCPDEFLTGLFVKTSVGGIFVRLQITFMSTFNTCNEIFSEWVYYIFSQ